MLAERLRKRREYKENLAELHQREVALYKDMKAVELYPGTLEELIAERGVLYEIIPLPEGKKHLKESRRGWYTLADEEKPRTHKFVKWALEVPGFYSGVQAEATKLKADVVVEWKEEIMGGFFNLHIKEKGTPVRKVGDLPAGPTPQTPQGRLL